MSARPGPPPSAPPARLAAPKALAPAPGPLPIASTPPPSPRSFPARTERPASPTPGPIVLGIPLPTPGARVACQGARSHPQAGRESPDPPAAPSLRLSERAGRAWARVVVPAGGAWWRGGSGCAEPMALARRAGDSCITMPLLPLRGWPVAPSLAPSCVCVCGGGRDWGGDLSESWWQRRPRVLGALLDFPAEFSSGSRVNLPLLSLSAKLGSGFIQAPATWSMSALHPLGAPLGGGSVHFHFSTSAPACLPPLVQLHTPQLLPTDSSLPAASGRRSGMLGVDGTGSWPPAFLGGRWEGGQLHPLVGLVQGPWAWVGIQIPTWAAAWVQPLCPLPGVSRSTARVDGGDGGRF